MELTKIISGEMYFYFDAAFRGMREDFIFDEKIDGDILKMALSETHRVHPYLTWTVREENGYFYYVDTGSAPTLICGTDHPELGSSQTDGNLAAVLFRDNRMSLDLYHGLMDGVASKRVVETLLYFYYSIKDGKQYSAENLMTERCSDLSLLYREPFEIRIPDEDLPEAKEDIPADEVFRFSEHEDVSSRDCFQRISISSTDFMRFAKENGASPASALPVLICHAIRKLYPEDQKTFRINIPINLRDALGCSETFRNATGDIPLFLRPDMMDETGMEEQCAFLRKSLKEKLLPENQRRIARSQMDFLKVTGEYGDYASRYAFYRNIPIPPSDSVFISYIGKINGDSYVDHIREASLLNGARDGIVFNIYDCGGRFHLSMAKKGSLSAFTDRFLSLMESCGISAEASRETDFTLAYVPLRESLGLDF